METSPIQRTSATLASIAAELGISRTTVSNAYNRPDQLSPKLREDILQAARKLGYAGPNPVARSLRTRKVGAIGLVLTEHLDYAFRDPAALAFLESLAAVCERNESALTLLPGAAGMRYGHELSAIRGAPVDGFVLYSMPDNDPGVQAVLARNTPTVVVDGGTSLSGTSYVGVDNVGAMIGVAKHVTDLGHRRIGVVTFHLAGDSYNGLASLQRQRSTSLRTGADRLLGLAQGLTQADIDWSAVPVEERSENSVASGADAARTLLTRDPSLTAIICLSDVLAAGVLEYAASESLSVPAQLAVTGFDDLAGAERHGLTTVRQPMADKGRLAGEALLGPNGWIGPGARTILPTELVVRRSTAG